MPMSLEPALLIRQRIPPEQISAIFDNPANEDVTLLVLANSWEDERVGALFFTCFLANLNAMPSLTMLQIEHNHMGDTATQALAKFLEKRPLRTLVLSHTYMGDTRIMALSGVIAFQQTLQSLILTANDLTDSTAMVLAHSLGDNAPWIHLDLTSNQITDFGGCALAYGLKTNTILQGLILRNNQLHSGGPAVLADILRSNTTLKVLDLSRNWIDDVGAQTLALLVGQTETLTSLSLLTNEKIGNSSMKQFAYSLAFNTSITSLELDGPGSGTRRAEGLAYGHITMQLHKNNTLRRNQDLTLRDLCLQKFPSELEKIFSSDGPKRKQAPVPVNLSQKRFRG